MVPKPIWRNFNGFDIRPPPFLSGVPSSVPGSSRLGRHHHAQVTGDLSLGRHVNRKLRLRYDGQPQRSERGAHHEPGKIPTFPFGGVWRDLQSTVEGPYALVFDTPFSLVGDVVTLPFVLATKPHSTDVQQTSDDIIAKTELSDQPKTSDSVGEDVLRVGMTVDEVLTALEAAKMDSVLGGAGWTKFWCRSPRYPDNTVSLTFDHDASDTPQLKQWYLTDGQ